METVLQKGEEYGSDLVMKISAICLQKEQARSRHTVRHTQTNNSVLQLGALDKDSPAFDVVAVLDPASRGSQLISHLLIVLQKTINANIKVLMNCREKLSEMPVKNFFRYVLQPELTFSESGELSSGPFGRFNDLPQNVLLTLNMKVPESWMVASVEAKHDLDNIRLEDTDMGVSGEFELEYLLLEGLLYNNL